MASPASIAKHPFHPMFVVFPIGLWVFSLVADIIYLAGKNAAWSIVAYYCIIGGIVGGLIAAIFGFIDWASLKPSRAKRVGTTHMILNLVITALFIINFAIRSQPTFNYTGPFILSIISIVLLVISGWLGGEMVYVHGVAVEGKIDVDRDPSEERRRREQVAAGRGSNR